MINKGFIPFCSDSFNEQVLSYDSPIFGIRILRSYYYVTGVTHIQFVSSDFETFKIPSLRVTGL